MLSKTKSTIGDKKLTIERIHLMKKPSDNHLGIVASNLTVLMRKMVDQMLLWKPKQWTNQFYKSTSGSLRDVEVFAQTCKYPDVDISKQMWVSPSRWTRLIRSYVSKSRLEKFLERIPIIQRRKTYAPVSMMFNDTSDEHENGGCMLHITFQPNPATLHFHSRSAYIGGTGVMDLALVAAIARLIDEPTIRFRWTIGLAQLHSLRIIPYLHAHPDLLKKLLYWHRRPRLLESKKSSELNWWHIIKWYDKCVNLGKQCAKRGKKFDVQKAIDVGKFGPYRRVSQRWAEHKKLCLPSTATKPIPAEKLNFNKLRDEEDFFRLPARGKHPRK
jgi:hypothetical protein